MNGRLPLDPNAHAHLVAEELGLRIKVQAHNDEVTTTLASIAAQMEGISPSTVDAYTVGTAADVPSSSGDDDHNPWFEDAWNTAKTSVGVGGAVVGAEAEAGWPHVQDAAAVVGNRVK